MMASRTILSGTNLKCLSKQLVQSANMCTNSLNTAHHATGSPLPVIDPDKLTLLNMRFCPYAQRTILCLNAKGVPYQTINCALMNKPSWLWELNPLGKVPVLMHKGVTIYESLVTCDYVDEAYSGRKLHSEDPARRATDKMLVELFNKVIIPHMKIWFGWKIGQGPEDRAKHFSDSLAYMDHFERELSSRGTQYFSGPQEAGWLDYMLWPWYERLEAYRGVYPGEEGLIFPQSRLPLTTAWMDRMAQDPAVVPYLLSNHIHVEFIKTLVAGNPNYDLIVDQ